MGQVYRARDTTLNRDVALKVLPDSFANDPERLARFEREAHVLASLNHPNIAHIHGLERSGGVSALVIELVEGEDLWQRLTRGAIPTDEALPIARQIVEALEAAHDQGIIHRDLKPANIKVRPDGLVKVLDFGLAKALEPAGGAPGASHTPTITTPTMTRPGVVLGTAAYMSPEQAKGRPADRRSDVWAFGAVLFEMLTGTRAFKGEDVSDTLAAILRDEPAWSSLPSDTPAPIKRLLRRCLVRDARKRLRDIGDARLDIEEAIAAPSSDIPAPQAAARPATLAQRALPWLVGLAVGAVAGSAAWGLLRPESASSAPPIRTTITAPPAVEIVDVALAPDGRTLAFTGTQNDKSRIYVRALDQIEAVPLTGSEGGRRPFFSPDSQWIGFASGSAATGDSALNKVPRAGGTVVTICRGEFAGGSWGPDGTIVLGSQTGLHIVQDTGGTPAPLTSVTTGELHRGPVFLPGDRSVLFHAYFGTDESSQIEVISLDTRERRKLVAGSTPQIATGGLLVFARGGSLWAVAFDPGRAVLRGEPVRIAERVQSSASGFVSYALAGDGGTLVYQPAAAARRRLPVWVDREGHEAPVGIPAGQFDYPRISTDGTRVAFVGGDEANRDVWLYDLGRSLLSRFTVHPSQDGDPAWEPNRRRLVFHSHRDGPGNIYAQATDGTGEVERITTGAGEQVPIGFSPDGRWLVYWDENATTGFDLYKLAVGGARPAEVLLKTPANEAASNFSPDGRFIAYASDESGRAEVYVRPFPDVNRTKWQISSGGGQSPVWNPRGRELVYRSGARMLRVSVETAPDFAAGKPEVLFERPYLLSAIDTQHYDIAPDGKRFLMVKETSSAIENPTQSQLVLVQNWASDLKRGPSTLR